MIIDGPRRWATVAVLLAVATAPRPPSEDLRYEHRQTDDPHSIHILEIDPHLAGIVAARARDAGRGRERVSSLARRAGAVAAINGGFFRIGGEFDGEPSGALRIDGHWFSEARLPRGAIGWSDEGRRVLIDRLRVGFRLQSGRWLVPVDGLNRPRGRNETVVYTSRFGASTPGGAPRQLVATRDGSAGFADGAPQAIPEGGWVAALASSEIPAPPGRIRLVADIEPGDASRRQDWSRMEMIVGGTPVLLRDGEPISDFSAEKVGRGFLNERHPRTAVCIKPDGHWLLVAVDGRQPRLSIGMTMAELTDLMIGLGCRDALNLDGGGSTTFFWRDEVINSPSDPTGERPVSDAILVLDRKP